MTESLGVSSTIRLAATIPLDPVDEASTAKAPAPPPPVEQPVQPPAATARSLAQRLDSLFLQAAQDTTRTVSRLDLNDTVSRTSLPLDKRSALNQAVAEAADSYRGISQLTGREIAAAIRVDDKGRFEWKLSLHASMIEDALEKQGELAALLHQAASDPNVKGEEFEILSEMALQADRRQVEILTLALQLADATQQRGDDPEVVARLDAKLAVLLPHQALSMHGNEAAIEKMKAQLQPLVDRMDALASHPNASISSAEFAALQHEIASARNALDRAAKEGFPTPDGGRWMPDKAFFTRAKELIAEVEEEFSDVRQSIGLDSMRAFVDDAFAIPERCSLIKKRNLGFLQAVAPNLARAASLRHQMYEQAMVYIEKSLEKNPDPETVRESHDALSRLSDLADEYRKIKAKDINDEIKAIKGGIYSFDMKEDDWKVLQAFFKEPRGILSQVRHLERCINHINYELSPEEFLSTDSARALLEMHLERHRVFSSIVEARIHGMTAADVNPKLDDSNLVSSKKLGHGAANTVFLVKYKDGSEAVFKPEAAGRQGVEGLALSKDYEADQQVAQLNLATQKTAEVLGLDDVMPKSTVGCHDSRYGLFMEKAPGSTALNFAKGLPPEDGGLTPAQIKGLDDEQYSKVLGEVIRQTNRLEWLDLITGQGDRHYQNYLIDVRPNGKVTVKGIDNDECFPGYRTGLRSFHLSEPHARAFKAKREEIIKAYPLAYQPEIRARLESDPGVVESPSDKGLDIDATKFVAGELHYALKKVVGLHGAVLPDFIDEDLYNRLQTLKKGNPARDTYLAELRKRLPDKAVASATARLDQAIDHAESLMQNGMVISHKDFWKQDEQKRILHRELSGGGMTIAPVGDDERFRLSDGDVVKAFKYQIKSLFMRDLTKLCREGWLN